VRSSSSASSGAGRREVTLERRARGSKKGDLIGQGPHEVNSGGMGGQSGGFGTSPGKKLGTLDKD
jgi:hypothetical protein